MGLLLAVYRYRWQVRQKREAAARRKAEEDAVTRKVRPGCGARQDALCCWLADVCAMVERWIECSLWVSVYSCLRKSRRHHAIMS
jgi:hypothetical protein